MWLQRDRRESFLARGEDKNKIGTRKYVQKCSIFWKVCFFFLFEIKSKNGDNFLKFMNLRFMRIYNIHRKFWKELTVKANLLAINFGWIVMGSQLNNLIYQLDFM